jgi:hypothetical protein
MNIEEFYEADERRRRSEEIEVGTEWHDGHGARYELSWVADTGELYVMREPGGTTDLDFFGDGVAVEPRLDAVTVLVVGWIADRARLEQVLDGWQAAMAGPDGIGWLSERLRQAAVPREAPA